MRWKKCPPPPPAKKKKKMVSPSSTLMDTLCSNQHLKLAVCTCNEMWEQWTVKITLCVIIQNSFCKDSYHYWFEINFDIIGRLSKTSDWPLMQLVIWLICKVAEGAPDSRLCSQGAPKVPRNPTWRWSGSKVMLRKFLTSTPNSKLTPDHVFFHY